MKNAESQFFKKILKNYKFSPKTYLNYFTFFLELCKQLNLFSTFSKRIDFRKEYECDFIHFWSCTLHPALIENTKFLNKNLTLRVRQQFCHGIYEFILIQNNKSVYSEYSCENKTDPTHKWGQESKLSEKSLIYKYFFLNYKKNILKLLIFLKFYFFCITKKIVVLN